MSVKETNQKERKEVSEKKGTTSPYFEAFTTACREAGSPVEKLRLILSFMEESLARKEGPRFGDFWEARKLCLPLFRKGVEGEERADLWTSYTYLTLEAKSRRDAVDQEGQFALEQIELALEAIEHDVASRKKATVQVHAIELPGFLRNSKEEYQARFADLVVLEALSTRITSLRQELIDTQLRMRQKNALFQRLSAAGDEVFPPRKALLKEVTDVFLQDVETFSKVKFPDNSPRGPLHVLRDEIKSFQSLAKCLHLTPKGFHKSRQVLSQCWDAVREQSDERRKEWAQKREVFKENKLLVTAKIEEFAKNYAETEPSVEEAKAQVAEITTFMREVDLGRDEIQELKDELVVAQAPMQAKLDEAEALRKAEEEAIRQEREAAIQELRASVEDLLTKTDDLTAEEIITARDEALVAIKEASVPKFEKATLEKRLRALREVIRRKKEEALLDLSDDDKQALVNLQEVLRQRKERRSEIRAKLQEIRKEKGGSGLDFERAMELNELESEQRAVLDEAEAGVREIEERLEKLKG